MAFMKRAEEEALTDIRDYLKGSARVQEQVAAECADSIRAAADLLIATFRAGGKLLLCGNGGSAADCQHMATELVSRLSKEFERPALPAIALTTDTSLLTAIGNDLGFAGVFERQVRALGKPGDVLMAISTSGNSVNVLRATQAARETGMRIVGLQGEGGKLKDVTDFSIVIPSRDTQHIQEAMLSIEHFLCHMVEVELFAQENK
jgi:D-sedoheptulose 7-phosphate isomerase